MVPIIRDQETRCFCTQCPRQEGISYQQLDCRLMRPLIQDRTKQNRYKALSYWIDDAFSHRIQNMPCECRHDHLWDTFSIAARKVKNRQGQLHARQMKYKQWILMRPNKDECILKISGIPEWEIAYYYSVIMLLPKLQ